MLSFPVFYSMLTSALRSPVVPPPRLGESPHQYHSMGLTLPLFSYSYALFCTMENPNSLRFISFRTRCTKHPGGGIPCFSAPSVRGGCLDLIGALKSARAQFPIGPFDAGRRPRVHPACPEPRGEDRRPTVSPAPFVTFLDAASSISPVFAALTKNMGGGVSRPFSRLATASCLGLDWVGT
jgi:hypothetical protein